MTSCTPARPRFFRPVRNARQNISSSLSPTSRPRISRRPSAVTPVATTTALDTTWPRCGAHVQVGRVQVDVGERGVVQGAGAERADHLIEPGADPGHLGLGDPGSPPRATTRSSTRAGGDPVDVGLHHHRVQGLVDPPPRLQDGREERALAQLRDPQLRRRRPGWSATCGRDPLRSVDAVLGAFVAVGADHLGRLRPRSAPAARPGPTRGSCRRRHRCGTPPASSDRADWDKAIGEISFGACLAVHTEESRRWPPHVRTPRRHPKPHHSTGTHTTGANCWRPSDAAIASRLIRRWIAWVTRGCRRPWPSFSPSAPLRSRVS